MYQNIRPYVELARLDKPIGIYLLLWPSLLGLLISGFNSNIGFEEFFIVIIGSILVRSCGCVINDISDFKIDKLVKRTVGRPLASGAVTLQSAWRFFFLLSFLSILILLFTNPFTIKMSMFFALLIVLYPLTKRFFVAPQIILGITFGSGSIISYSLVSDTFTVSILLLYVGIIAWIVSFDTIYAFQDKEDDIKIGVKSTAILWGTNSIKICQYLQIFFYFMLTLVALINSFSFYFIITLIVLILLLVLQKKLINQCKFLEAFKINNLIGLVAVISFYFEIII
ncbi:MAG: 4-hydroxybenzoate octaprenyltransferase [Gammaproteobacteria bacterium]|nr:4-hydroxybenzoate octaprenyltransferase [Gammaproteobacteria bacterium]